MAEQGKQGIKGIAKGEFPVFRHSAFETGLARGNLTADMLFNMLDYRVYFRCQSPSLPHTQEEILQMTKALIYEVPHIPGICIPRKDAYSLPVLRNVLAYVLVQQDFTIHGAGSTIEIFSDRIEITSPESPYEAEQRNEKMMDLI